MQSQSGLSLNGAIRDYLKVFEEAEPPKKVEIEKT